MGTTIRTFAASSIVLGGRSPLGTGGGKLTRPTVLIVCTHNSARSQMAEGLVRHDHGETFEACSAGTEATRVNPLAILAMQEIGIDLRGHRSKTLAEIEGVPDFTVTVCDSAREQCPFAPARIALLHHSFRDPSTTQGSDHERLQAFREVRDEIRRWLAEQVPQWRAQWEGLSE